MRFKVDENLPVEVAELLQRAGHEALTVHDQGLAGETDSALATACQSEHRALITLDTDFADIRTYPPGHYSGLVVLRLKQQDRRRVLEVVSRLVKAIAVEDLVRHLWIVDERRIRVRD